MKNKVIYMGIVLMAFTITNLLGQNNPEPRRTAAEQAAFEKTVPVNPAKISVQNQADPKKDASVTEPPVNWKPVQSVEPERNPANIQLKISQPEPVVNTTVQERKQPEAPLPSNTSNRQVSKGTLTQPVPPQTGKPDNLKNIKGNPTQPIPPRTK